MNAVAVATLELSGHTGKGWTIGWFVRSIATIVLEANVDEINTSLQDRLVKNISVSPEYRISTRRECTCKWWRKQTATTNNY